MGFLDSLGDTVKKMGRAAIAGPGVIYDMASYVVPGEFMPGDNNNNSFGQMLNSMGSRLDSYRVATPEPIRHAFSETMHGAYVAYHEAVDQPLSTLQIQMQHASSLSGLSDRLSAVTDPDQWKQAYAIAEHQSFGQSSIYGLANSSDASDPFKLGAHQYQVADPVTGQPTVDPKTGKPVMAWATPFSETVAKTHPLLANASAFGLDLGVSWFLDPAALAGKAFGAYRTAKVLGHIPEASRANFGEKLDSSLIGTNKGFKSVDWAGRFDDFFKYISGDNHTGQPLRAAEIRASSKEIQLSRDPLRISGALEDALKLEDPVDRANAARRVFAVAAGDTTQVDRLRTEVAGTQAIADKLKNILDEKTVDLQAQALNRFRTDSPEFRAAFDRQLANLDADGNLTEAIQAWRKNVVSDLSTKGGLLSLEHTLDHMPAVHKGLDSSRHGLKVATGTNLLNKVEGVHDATFAKVERLLPDRASYSSVFQHGLGSLPFLAIYPAKFVAATLPTKAVPAIVRGLRTVHYTGVVNVHDWDAASDQLNSLMIHAGVDNQTRISHLSDVYKASTEMQKRAVTDRVEQVAMDAIAREAGARYGLEIDRDYVQQAMRYGQSRRGSSLNAMMGSRQFSATEMPDDMAARARSISNIRTADKIAGQRAKELNRRGLATDTIDPSPADNWHLRVDQFIDESGTPVALPLDTSDLVNHIPLLDVHMVKQMTNDKAFVDRLKTHADMWKDASLEKQGLQADLMRATGDNILRIQRRLENIRMVQDQLLNTASLFNRVWKAGVLFRLGYPMRVLADDHMRIAARIGYLPFLMANLPEAARNSYYNYLPRFAVGSRKADAVKQLRLDENTRATLVSHYAGNAFPRPHTDKEWADLQDLIKAHLDGTETKAQAARRAALDPEGRITEWHDLTQQAKTLKDDGALAQVRDQLAGRPDPNEVRKQLQDLDKRIRGGARSYRDPKRHVGEARVNLGDGNSISGAFGGPAAALREATSSSPGFEYQMTDGEEINFRLHSSGHWKTIKPGEPGYYQLWANVLNHQIKHGPGFMAIVSGKVKNIDEFASWLHQPEQRHIIDRVGHYALDPQDYGGRLFAHVEDYLPTQELRDMVTSGRVSAQQLEKMFPDGDPRLPNIHGSSSDVQSGRHGVVQASWEQYQRFFRYLSEVPTDRLSRHPFFNAVYKIEAKKMYEGLKAAKGAENFTEADAALIERVARKKALAELKRTLWDVSAHSHAAHVLRFISPFFAAHQEALNRWWNIAKDDPSIVRKFQMAFDAPRRAGMTYNDQTGEVMPGDAIGGPGNKIMLKIPFAGDDNAVNRWLREHGGGKYWSVNESGFNLILQNGILNPGVGPMVTVPMESLVQKYPSASEFAKVARALNQYPPPPGSGHYIAGLIDPSVALNATIPAWSKHMLAAYRGPKSAEFASLYAQNMADELVTWNKTHDGIPPTTSEMADLQDKVNKRTHTDLMLESASNAFAITPAKPNSKYALVQDGLNRLYQQMRNEGHDMTWLRQQFWQQYGEIYMPMIYSMSSNPARLNKTVAEVNAIQKRRGLVDHLPPSLVRMAIGPDVAGQPEESQMYSPSAASWLATQETGEPGTSYAGKKDPRQVATQMVVQQGWDQYDQLTNALDVVAQQAGLNSYEDSPQLVEARRKGLEAIKASNPIFAHTYDNYSGSNYDELLDGMRMIASNRALQKDPTRSNDVYWLNQYLQLHDAMNAVLTARGNTGGAKTMGAQSNAGLAQQYAKAVSFIMQQSPYLRQYGWSGIIEHDPLLPDSSLVTGVQ